MKKHLKNAISEVSANILFECGAIAVLCFVACVIANLITSSVMHMVEFFTRWKRW